MFKISIEQVKSDLKAMFQVTEDKYNEFRSFAIDGKYNINKQQLSRIEVLAMLQNYFSDKVIDGGYVEVSDITLVFTSFEVCEGVAKKTDESMKIGNIILETDTL